MRACITGILHHQRQQHRVRHGHSSSALLTQTHTNNQQIPENLLHFFSPILSRSPFWHRSQNISTVLWLLWYFIHASKSRYNGSLFRRERKCANECSRQTVTWSEGNNNCPNNSDNNKNRRKKERKTAWRQLEMYTIGSWNGVPHTTSTTHQSLRNDRESVSCKQLCTAVAESGWKSNGNQCRPTKFSAG